MSQQKSQDNSANLESNVLIISVAVVLLAIILWAIFGKSFSVFMAHLRRIELFLFMPFFNGAAELYGRLTAVKGVPLDFGDTVAMLTKTGNYVRWLYAPPIAVMAVYLYTKSFRGRFQKRHTMSTLSRQEAALWPEIAPVAGKQVEMVSGDITQGAWAVSMTEWEYAEKHKLAKRGGKLDRELTRDVFIKQLGPLWAGPKALPIHARAVLAALILRVAGKRDESLAAFRKMSSTFEAGGLKGMDTSWVDAAIAEHGNHAYVQRVYTRHAYVFTVMATMLQISRADGVNASPLFIWLKTVDRRLWYTLNGVGRYAFFVESAGIMSHWLFEKTVGQACPSPMVEKAIDGLELGLSEYSENDELERLYS